MATHSSILAWRIPMDRGAWQAAVYECMKCYFSLKGWQTNYDYSDLEIWPAFSQKWTAVSLTHPGKQLTDFIANIFYKKNLILENWYLAEMTGCFRYCMMKCVSIWKICKLGEPIFSKWPAHSVTKPGMWVKRFIQIASETKVFLII